MAIIETDHNAITNDGRAVALLRGTTRQNLDVFLVCGNLAGTGVGRSAFIMAALDFFSELDENDPIMQALIQRGAEYEQILPR